ncbi:putative membrane protein YfcA [Bradyrhizobium yuanmingense]
MRFRFRKTAHVFERVGLAMAGAACGLFVGAYVGSAIPTLTTQGFLLLMMLLGRHRLLSRHRHAADAFRRCAQPN